MKEIIIDGITYIPKSSTAEKLDGLEYCIIRTYSAGVWAGYVDRSVKGYSRTVKQARRLWRWWSEFTLSALAVEGVRKDKEEYNKYAMPVDEIDLENVLEVIPCTKKAQEQIINIPNYSE